MNANFGILEPVYNLDKRKKDLKKQMMAERSLAEINSILERIND